MKKNDNKGFSLVELIIVIAIMVILVAVTAPQFLKYVERSKVATDVQTASELATAIQVELAEGTSATSLSGTAASIIGNIDSMTTAPTRSSKAVVTDTNFFVAISGNDVTIYAGNNATSGRELYPHPGTDFSAYVN